jgi:Domain of unknown function (DUF4440)
MALVGAGVLVLAVAGGAAAILASKGKATVPASSAARTAERVAVSKPQPALVPASEAEAVLTEYATAYSAKDPERLAALLAPTLIRRNGNRAPENRGEAIATYQGQFRELNHPTYRLIDVKVTPEAGGALASAVYRITSQNGTVQSPITFHLVPVGGRLEMDKITIPPGP